MKIYFEKQAQNFFNFGWSHGRYLDYWSFVHILTGIIFGLIVLIFNLNPIISILIMIVGFIVYEFLEMLTHVAEDFQNVVSDIVLGTIGGYLTIFYLIKIISYNHLFVILPICIIVNLLFIRTGWRHYLKKKSKKGGMQKVSFYLLCFIYIMGIFTSIISFVYWVIKILI